MYVYRKLSLMKFSAPIAIQWMADFIDAQLIGNKEGYAAGINEIHKVEKGDLVFVDHPKYYDKCLQSPADFIIINKAVDCPEGKALLWLTIRSKHTNPSSAISDPSSQL